ncbi:hypothetical protein COF36_00410 [Bacillus pseudomycoides]|uniref:DUF3949 domain-containing protein n=2 Tax=Bacillus pseudomycoides TaxID=64104 RepID=UPI000BFBE201|nr:DUF3949 domain-containing protein [Bacillus pseudomycoides]PHC98460.1 hypothetical protein COF36_00410 [Bacillus pseudomycoides]
MDELWVFVIMGIVYVLIMIPIQYMYISGLKEKQKEMKVSQHELYEKMSFEEEQLHYNVQGNLFNLPSFLIASFIYKVKHQ